MSKTFVITETKIHNEMIPKHQISFVGVVEAVDDDDAIKKMVCIQRELNPGVLITYDRFDDGERNVTHRVNVYRHLSSNENLEEGMLVVKNNKLEFIFELTALEFKERKSE